MNRGMVVAAQKIVYNVVARVFQGMYIEETVHVIRIIHHIL